MRAPKGSSLQISPEGVANRGLVRTAFDGPAVGRDDAIRIAEPHAVVLNWTPPPEGWRSLPARPGPRHSPEPWLGTVRCFVVFGVWGVLVSVPGVGPEAAGDGVLVVAGVGGGLMDVGVVVAGLGGVSWSGILAGAFDGGAAAPHAGGVGVVELVGPVDPQVVLGRVRLTAGVSGRLLVLLVGELRKDPRKGGLHIGLGAPGQGSAAVRYSGLPWEWLTGELAVRPHGSTTVLLDVAAEAGAWEAVRTGGLPEVPGVGVFGRVVRQGRESRWRRLRGGTAAEPVAPAYLLECVRLWRAGGRTSFAELHERAATASVGENPEAVFVTPTAPVTPTTAPGPGVPGGQPSLREATALPPGPGPLPHPGWEQHSRADQPPWTPHNGHPAMGSPTAAPEPANGAAPPPQAATPPQPDTAYTDGAQSAGVPETDAVHAAEPAGPPPADREPAGRSGQDPHEAIMAAARAGRHDEAEAIALSWENVAEQTEGPGSEGVLHWVEVRADLARLAGDAARSCELWMWVARGRLERGEAENAPEVEGAVDRAHHQWQRLDDEETARDLAPELVVLRRRVPGRQPGALRILEERAERLLGGVEQ